MVTTESVKDILSHLNEKQKIEIMEFLKKEINTYKSGGKRIVSEHSVPLSCFKHGLSGLETVCVYMKDELKMKFSEIAKEINRSAVTVRLSYRNAKQKRKERLDTGDMTVRIPTALLKDRSRTALQHVVRHLKDEQGISFKEIGLLLDRDYKTIWTAYTRGGKK